MNRNRILILRAAKRSAAFSLVELLVVMAISSILFALVSAGMQAAMGDKFTSSVSQIANTMVRARAYAMSNNTYVFVGIQEVSAATSAGTTPQTAGSGRIGMVVVATNDGSRGYDATSATFLTLPQNATAPYTSTQLTVVSPLTHFDNVHICARPTISNFSLSGLTGVLDFCPTTVPITSRLTKTLTQFTWPLNATTAQYTFGGTNSAANQTAVIQFDPQGEAQVFNAANSDSNFQWIEMDIEPTHGSTIPASVSDKAAILIDGPSGGVSIYRT